MPGKDSRTPGSLSISSARRTQRVVEHVERTSLGGGPGQASRAPIWTPSNVRARCTEEIGEGSWGSLGEGKARIYYYNETDGWYAGDEVDVLNQYGGGPIPVDASLLLAWISGFWFVSSADC